MGEKSSGSFSPKAFVGHMVFQNGRHICPKGLAQSWEAPLLLASRRVNLWHCLTPGLEINQRIPKPEPFLKMLEGTVSEPANSTFTATSKLSSHTTQQVKHGLCISQVNCTWHKTFTEGKDLLAYSPGVSIGLGRLLNTFYTKGPEQVGVKPSHTEACQQEGRTSPNKSNKLGRIKLTLPIFHCSELKTFLADIHKYF